MHAQESFLKILALQIAYKGMASFNLAEDLGLHFLKTFIHCI